MPEDKNEYYFVANIIVIMYAHCTILTKPIDYFIFLLKIA